MTEITRTVVTGLAPVNCGNVQYLLDFEPKII